MILAVLFAIFAAVASHPCPGTDCLIVHGDKCLWVEGSHDTQITFAQGEKICADKGGKPGNIYSKAEHDKIYAYMSEIAKKEVPNHQFYIWLGLKYNRATNSATLSDGTTPAPYTHWGPGFPSTAYCCHVTLVTGTSPVPSPTHGSMHNWIAATPGWRRGILCEK